MSWLTSADLCPGSRVVAVRQHPEWPINRQPGAEYCPICHRGVKVGRKGTFRPHLKTSEGERNPIYARNARHKKKIEGKA